MADADVALHGEGDGQQHGGVGRHVGQHPAVGKPMNVRHRPAHNDTWSQVNVNTRVARPTSVSQQITRDDKCNGPGRGFGVEIEVEKINLNLQVDVELNLRVL